MREPKFRHKLNEEQLQTLTLLLEFRYATRAQLARWFGRSDATAIYGRLRILVEQGFIAKRYDRSYKLPGRPAEYYLLPSGAKKLRATTDFEAATDQAVKNLYKNKTTSDTFVSHCLSIFETCLQLRESHGEDLKFFTKANFNLPAYDYFPHPLPDGYIRFGKENEERHFFLDIFEDATPFFVLISRIKKYLAYADSDDWEWEFPVILMVVESSRRQKQLIRRIQRELDGSNENVTFAVAVKDVLLSNEEAWLRIDADALTSLDRLNA